MDAIRERPFLSEPGAGLPEPTMHRLNAPPAVAANSAEEGDTLTFHFEQPGADGADCTLTPAQEQAFRADLERELAVVQDWFEQWDWLPDCQPDLRIVVSHRFRISKALVPAWHGQHGRMEFPNWRVAGGKAAIAHELTHVCFPNANRFLAEGLAIHVQAEIGSNPAFPNFGEPLHQLARNVLHEITDFESRSLLLLAELDAIATPDPLVLKVGANFYDQGPQGQRVIYPLAGSFVSFLIETRGMTKFRELYRQTPFRLGTRDAGTSDRWRNVYGLSLAYLEVEWKTMIANGDRAAADLSTRESHGA